MVAISDMVRSAMRDTRPISSRADAGARMRLVAPVILFVLMAARAATGLPSLCHLPYWYLSYSEGFIRRALVGTFTMPLLVGRPLPEVLAMIAGFGVAAGLALIAMLAVRFSRRGVLDALPIVFLFSGALPWLISDLGTLDAFLVLASLCAFVLLDRGNPVALALCVAAPLIHEGALFLLMPLCAGLFLLAPDRRWLALAGAATVVATAGVLWLFSTTHFTWPAGMPLGVADNFVEWELGQHLHLFAPRMTAGIWVFSIAPSLALAALAGKRAGWLIGCGVLAGVAITWSVVPIAIDTERLFAWGPFTAVLLAELAQRRAPIGSRSEQAGP